MTQGAIQIGVYFGILIGLARPLGIYLARVFDVAEPNGKRTLWRGEGIVYRWCRIDPQHEMTWTEYARCVLALGSASTIWVYLVQRFQGIAPWNPDRLPAVAPDLAFNTAMSFVTNTNWQSYAGETTLSYFSQMLGLTVQNFLSAAVGIAVLVALMRGFVRQRSTELGNCWVDVVRGTLYVLLPMSFGLALLLTMQGVVQTWDGAVEYTAWESQKTSPVDAIRTEIKTFARGPVASQIAIKQLGTNGGGFFNANSAHPFENPTPLTNLLEMLAILILPVALCESCGVWLGDRRQGRSLTMAMFVLMLPLLGLVWYVEQAGNPLLRNLGVDDQVSASQPGGNMEGKEARFGIVNSALWAVATTAASNGSVNAMHDSLMPLSGLATMWLIQSGEVVFGGVGSGLYGMLTFAVLTVFLAGLMVGRTPEYWGKKIGAFEIQMAALVILLPCAATLLGTALAVLVPIGRAATANSGPHGFSEILYALSSASNNNGSAFAGLAANNPFYNGLLACAMFVGRYGVMIPILAMSGSLATKRTTPRTVGTLPTDTYLFVGLLVAVVLIVGALSFFPALALGPIIEHLQLHGQ